MLIEKGILEANILKMQKKAYLSGVKLRPHIKTHKIPEIARMQLLAGACGIAAAKLGEAEVMAANGISDIQIANIIIGENKIRRLKDLHCKINRLTCTVDSIEVAAGLSEAFRDSEKKLGVFIEINTGHDRSGLKEYDEILNLANEINKLPGISLAGLLTHAGHIYSSKSYQEVMAIGNNEGEQMVALADKLRKDGIRIEEVSVGSTPGASFSASVPGVTELRAGNYVYHDMIQCTLGSASIGDCALSVLATVISKTDKSRVIVDAGSKALSLDRLNDNNGKIRDYGYIYGKKATISRLSEEHGIIEHDYLSFSIGEKIRIIPNHACAVSNLFDSAFLVDGDEVIETYRIAARGKMS